ncbi:hypothetical protein MCAG_02584 [Micromonospora sp. ATCC 39149]|nr:hypothetical protein MCAG_02584 [Micromonospora sp. ATCC 39149]
MTYRQRCGERRAEAVLRTCSKCQFDFRSLAGGERGWQPRAGVSAFGPGPQAAAARPSRTRRVTGRIRRRSSGHGRWAFGPEPDQSG